MTEQQLKFLFDPCEYVTRRIIVLLSVHSGHFCKFILHFAWKTTCGFL